MNSLIDLTARRQYSSADPGTNNLSYSVYGISLHSEIPLSLPQQSGPGLRDIELWSGSPVFFAEAIADLELQSRSEWYQHAVLNDGSNYVRWRGLGEFLVSPAGDRITCGRAAEATTEAFQVYLLGQALSFALVKTGFEPLHATAIEVDGEAVVLLGDSGFGKSSLAACFLAAGHPLLTDDLLLLQLSVDTFEAYPGPPRIKLFPSVARHWLPRASPGVPMNAETEKLVIALGNHESCRFPLPLRAIYFLAAPHETRHARNIHIETLSRRDAFLALLANTFNYIIVDRSRLQRQVKETTKLVNQIAVKKLFYPRLLNRLTSVRGAILSDLNSIPPFIQEHSLV